MINFSEKKLIFSLRLVHMNFYIGTFRQQSGIWGVNQNVYFFECYCKIQPDGFTGVPPFQI